MAALCATCGSEQCATTVSGLVSCFVCGTLEPQKVYVDGPSPYDPNTVAPEAAPEPEPEPPAALAEAPVPDEVAA